MIAVVGEAIMDLVGQRDRLTFTARPGGSPYNVAIAAARLGAPTRLVARLSRDQFGVSLREHAAANGVDLSAVVSASEPSTVAITSVDDDGGASYEFYLNGAADWQWREQDLDVIERSPIVHFGSLASWTAPGDVVVYDAIARASGLVTYDPNVRPKLMDCRRQAQAVIERNVSVADVVKASDEDLRWLYPNADPGDISERWLAGRPCLVLVTAGRSGATAYRRNASVIHHPTQGVDVVDTVGAGDAWMGSFLADLDALGATAAESILALSTAQIAGLLDTATLVASLACARHGADPPSAADVARARRASTNLCG